MAAQTISGELAQTYRQIEALVMLTKCLPLRHPLPPMRGFAVSPDLALLLYELVHEHRPSLVVECGSGVSSLVIGYALKALGAGHLISFEHEARAAERSVALVGRHGLEVEETLVGKRAHLVFIDGPPGSLQPLARYPALRRLAPFLAPDAVVVLDDVARPDEWAITERWLREDPRLTLQRIAHEKGTAILTRSH